MSDNERLIIFDYLNYRGEKSIRTVRPARIEFNSNEWHPEKQWLLIAFDFDKKKYRSFAMKDISNLRPLEI